MLLAHPIYPLLVDVEGFESCLLEFMQKLGEHGILADSDPSLRESTFHDAAWYGLLFAVLGSGCHFSETEPRDRILRTRVFGTVPQLPNFQADSNLRQWFALSNVFATQTCTFNQVLR